MSSRSGIATTRRPSLRVVIVSAAAVVLLGAMALDTKVVRMDSAAGVQPGTFSAEVYGPSEFPKVQAALEQRAVSAATLASAIAKDRAAAAKQYGVEASAGTEIPIKFTGVVGKGDSGTFDVAVNGVPRTVIVRLQTGPFISGTDLRDATGRINFGQFANQIEYQNAGSALNRQMKKDVLSKVDTTNLSGKNISVVGVFLLTDANSWLVTPVKVDLR